MVQAPVHTQRLLRSMSTRRNKKWLLVARPKGAFDPSRDARLEEETVDLAACPADRVIVEVEMLSVDAFIRTMLDEEAFHGSVSVGDLLPAMGYGIVVAAGENSGKNVGARVMGLLGAQAYATVPVGGQAGVHPLLSIPWLPYSAALGLVGITTGLTAHVGVFSASQRPPRRGETVVVSAAAGACGSIAAQLAKTTGARVVGIAGGEKKSRFLMEKLGLDAAVDYKSKTKTLEEQLDAACPGERGPDGFAQGIDFYFDCVGGKTLDAVLNRIKPGARVVICGAVSQYSGNLNKGGVEGPANYLKLAERGASMTGYTVMQYMSSLPFRMASLLWYHARGKVVMHEHIEEGVEQYPSALSKMFAGEFCGRTLCRVKAPTA